MTVLDTFTFDFVSNSKQAKKDIADLDKQIAALAAKGNKRNEAEVKQLAELHKQRAQATRDLNDMTQAIDGQTSSLGKIFTAGAAALGSYIGFNALKNGILDVNKYNSALEITAKLTGQLPGNLLQIDAALESQGAAKGNFLQVFKAAYDQRAQFGQSVGDPKALLDQVRALVKGQSPAYASMQIQRLGLPLDEGSQAFLRTATDEQYAKAFTDAAKNAQLSNEQADQARAAEQRLTESTQRLNTAFTRMASVVMPHLADAMEYVSNLVGGQKPITKENYKNFGDYYDKRGLGGFLLDSLGTGEKAIGETLGAAGSKLVQGANAAGISDLLVKEGHLSQANADGIIANLIRESGLNPNAVGDKGKAYGIGQWHPDRQADFARVFGHDIHGSTLEEQVQFLLWELHNTHKKAGEALKGANASQSGAAFSLYDESPGDSVGEAMRRAALAAKLAQEHISAANASPYNAQSGGTTNTTTGDKTVHVKIDNVTVHTQATDAQTMAKAAAQHLSSQIQFALNQFDDGAFA